MNSPWSFDGDGTLLSGRRWVVYACPDCAEPEGAVSGRRARAASTHNGATTPGEPHRAWPPQTDTDPAWALGDHSVAMTFRSIGTEEAEHEASFTQALVTLNG